jgi:hypothetical protein
MKETSEKRLNARIVLGKCSKTKRVYGMRIEERLVGERSRDWVRTWAFKIDEEHAKSEGYDSEKTRGTMNPTREYPGCPYCGEYSLFQCACGKVFCAPGDSREDSAQSRGKNEKVVTATCPWCGETGEYHTVEVLDVEGGGR